MDKGKEARLATNRLEAVMAEIAGPDSNVVEMTPQGKKKKDPDPTSLQATSNRVLKAIQSQFKFTRDPAGRLFVFQAGRLQNCPDLWVMDWLRAESSEAFSDALVRRVHQNLKAGVPLMPDTPPLGKINLLDGLYDPLTGNIETPTIENWPSQIQIPIKLKKGAKCPLFDEFRKRVIPEDAQEYLLELLASHFLVDAFNQHMTWLIGTGGNGKGTYLKIKVGLVGRANSVPITFNSLANNRFAAARIHGRLLIYDADAELEDIRRSAIIKKITARDEIDVERKGEEGFEIQPIGKVCVCANDLPNSRDMSEGFAERPLIVPFDQKIRGTGLEQNQAKLVAAILAESSGILELLLPALNRLMLRGHFGTIPPSIKARTDAYKQQSNPLNLFADDHLLQMEGRFVQEAEIKSLFNEWAGENDAKPIKSVTIRDWIIRRWGTTVKYGREDRGSNTGKRGFHGLGLK